MAAGQLNSLAGAGQAQIIEEGDGVNYGLEFVETIGASAENIQQQVDFTGRLLFEINHGWTKIDPDKNRARESANLEHNPAG